MLVSYNFFKLLADTLRLLMNISCVVILVYLMQTFVYALFMISYYAFGSCVTMLFCKELGCYNS